MIKVSEFIDNININIIDCASSGVLTSVVVDGHYVGDLTKEFISKSFGDYNVKSLDIEYEGSEAKILVTLEIETDRAIRIPLIRREDDAK